MPRSRIDFSGAELALFDGGMPRWEYGGTFRQAWRGCSLMCAPWRGMGHEPKNKEQLAQFGRDCLVLLREAHVVNLDLEQFRALPRNREDLTDYDPDPHLPFRTLYVSIGDECMAGIIIAQERDGEAEEGDSLSVIPFWNMKPLALPISLVDPSRHMYQDLIATMLEGSEGDEEYAEDDKSVVLNAMADAMKVVRFLESANVDLDEPTSDEVSRQVRRNAVRHGTPIGLTVRVRSPRHGRRGETTAHIDFTHRFEVRGHYKHYGPDTRLFKATLRDRPHKIIQHPTRGEIVRIWTPNFVKGPPDKPLVPKVRIYPGPDQFRKEDL